ncbi:hypothetical protein JCM10213_003454 [Rhodosporidiobolus nylandii]
MATQAFNDDFTTTHGGNCCFVTVDPAFDTQISEAATLLLRLPSPPSLASSLSPSASSAVALIPAPAPEYNDTTGETEPGRPVDSPESLAAKRAVVADLVRAVSEAGPLVAASDREFEGWSNLVLSLVLGFTAEEELAGAVETLTASHAQKSPASAQFPSLPARYTALSTLFNALPPSAASAKLSVLHALVAFASSNDDVAVLSPILLTLPTILSSLSLSPQERATATLQIARALIAQGSAAASAARAVLAAASPETDGALADAYVALSLASPEVYDFTPLSALRPASKELNEVLQIFLRGDVAALSSFSLEGLKVGGMELSKDLLEKKLKLVKLAELASTRVGETVAYAEIAKALGVAEGEDMGEEVEGWVIDAIRATLLTGRLSQPTQTLSVTSALPPTLSAPSAGDSSPAMEKKHWQLVLDRLMGWKESLERVRATAERATGAGGAAPGQAGQEE